MCVGRAQVRPTLYIAGIVATRYKPVTQDALSASVGSGQSQEDSALRLYAETADHAQREAQSSIQRPGGTPVTMASINVIALDGVPFSIILPRLM